MDPISYKPLTDGLVIGFTNGYGDELGSRLPPGRLPSWSPVAEEGKVMAAESIAEPGLHRTAPGPTTPHAAARRGCSSPPPVSGPRPAPSARRKPAPCATRARRSSTAATGPASTASTASGVASPKRTAPRPASGSTCRSVGSPATPAATANPVEPRARPQSPELTDSPDSRPATCDGGSAQGVDLDSFAAVVRRARPGATGATAARVADLRRALQPHVLRRRRHPRVGAAPAAARSRARRPRTTWRASTRCSPRSPTPTCPFRARSRSATTSR